MKPLGNVGDGPHIGGHVFTDRAVAARRREDQVPLFIAERAGQTVDLGFGRQRHGRIVGKVQETANPPDEILDLLIVERIVQAQHRLGMGNLGQMRSRRRPDQLRG